MKIDCSKPVFVISDLHIGDGSQKDNLSRNNKEKLLHLFLDYIQNENGELIIVGDFLELWHYSLDNIISCRRALLDQLSEMNVSYVPGNHDAAAMSIDTNSELPHPFFNKTVRPFIRIIGGKRFKFMHGHEIDPFMWRGVEKPIRFFRPLAQLFTPGSECIYLSQDVIADAFLELGECLWILKKWAENRLSKAVEQCCSVVPNNKLASLKRGIRTYNILKRHNEDRARGFYDISVAGHTHKAGKFGDWYYNSGSWTGRTNNFLRISPDGSVELSDWDKDGPKIRTNALTR